MPDVSEAVTGLASALADLEAGVKSNASELGWMTDELRGLVARVTAIEERHGGADPPDEEPTPLPEPVPDPEPIPPPSSTWDDFSPVFNGPGGLAVLMFLPGERHDRYTIAAMIENGRPTPSVLEDQKPFQGLADFMIRVPSEARFVRIAARDGSGRSLDKRDFPVPWEVESADEVDTDTGSPDPVPPPTPSIAAPTLTKVDEGPKHAMIRIDAPGADSIEYQTP